MPHTTECNETHIRKEFQSVVGSTALVSAVNHFSKELSSGAENTVFPWPGCSRTKSVFDFWNIILITKYHHKRFLSFFLFCGFVLLSLCPLFLSFLCPFIFKTLSFWSSVLLSFCPFVFLSWQGRRNTSPPETVSNQEQAASSLRRRLRRPCRSRWPDP